jgi:hypothetical protein
MGLDWDTSSESLKNTSWPMPFACLPAFLPAQAQHSTSWPSIFYYLPDKGLHFQFKFGGISSDGKLKCPQETMCLLLCALCSNPYQTIPTEASWPWHRQKPHQFPKSIALLHYFICMENHELARRACLQHWILKTWHRYIVCGRLNAMWTIMLCRQ